MNWLCKSMLGVVAVAGLVSMGGASAPAATNYEAVVIENPSRGPIHYMVKWGDGEWKRYTVEGNSRYTHYIPVGSSIDPYIRFDNGNRVTREYRLVPYLVTDPWAGKPYVFRWNSGILDLYSK
jgi:hypothetical protein